ncbi:MAG: RICIN domain-containing protein, partial [Lachnospiraceae bacterium]|nr:RICIN domain-containing protein [Lachnospiraceae bacterium]
DPSGYTNTNVQIRTTMDIMWTSSQEEWIIYPYNYSDSYKIVLRADPNLALTALGRGDGANDRTGTTLTSIGNVIVSEFTGADEQLWKLESGGIQLINATNIKEESAKGEPLSISENKTWQSFCCPVTEFGDTVVWSSSNPQSVTVDTLGHVTTKTAGESIVSATITHSDNTQTVYACTIYVIIGDGTYYINNISNSYRIEYKNPTDYSENAPLRVLNSGTSEPTGRHQMYKIRYLGNGVYSFRSLLDCSMGWTRSSTNLGMASIGTADSSVPATAKWKIKTNSNGYYIHSDYGTSLTVTSPSSSGGNVVLQSYSSTNTLQNWTINKITKTYHGVTIKNKVNTLIEGNSVKFIAGMYSTYTEVYGQKGITWTVTNGTGSATINSSTGVLTGISQGTVTVTATYKQSSSQQWSESCTVTVIPIAEGTYFIQNRYYEKYIQVDDDDAPDYKNNGGIMEQWTFNGEKYQRWIFTHTGDGYYTITSDVSGYAITVPPGSETSDDVDLILKPYAGVDRQKWKITLTDHESYKIKAKSSESCTTKDLVMRINVQGLHSANGLNIQQRPYSDDEDYKDEWGLHKIGSKVMLLSIISTEGSHDHLSCYSDALRCFASTRYNEFNIVNTKYISATNCITQMESSNIFISRSHGGANSTCSWLKLFDTGTASRLYSDNIYDFSTSTALVNFGGVELMLYVGCTTAYGGNTANNLITASVNAGANYALGFQEEIDCNGANTWTSYFCEYYTNGQTIYDAAKNASDDTASDHFILNALGELNTDSYSIAH